MGSKSTQLVCTKNQGESSLLKQILRDVKWNENRKLLLKPSNMKTTARSTSVMQQGWNVYWSELRSVQEQRKQQDSGWRYREKVNFKDETPQHVYRVRGLTWRRRKDERRKTKGRESLRRQGGKQDPGPTWRQWPKQQERKEPRHRPPPCLTPPPGMLFFVKSSLLNKAYFQLVMFVSLLLPECKFQEGKSFHFIHWYISRIKTSVLVHKRCPNSVQSINQHQFNLMY